MANPSISRKPTNRGTALLAFLFLIVIAFSATLIFSLSRVDVEIQQQRKTSEALAQAKEALIAYAVTVDLSKPGVRPGDLPCPDRNSDGQAETSCGNASGSLQEQRLGRFPWRTLGIAEIRDASGEPIWYAVSNNFKNNTRTDVLNSDTPGSITLRGSNGNILQDACSDDGVVAVLIAPGTPITRQDGFVQSRQAGNENDPKHYLDNIATEDNADFADLTAGTCSPSTLRNGFFYGPVRSSQGNMIANDVIIAITRKEIMTAIEKRVSREVLNELSSFYAANRYYPRPAAFDDSSCFGTSSVSGYCLSASSGNAGRIPATLSDTWPTPLLRGSNASIPKWFQVNGWREHVFYAVANACIDGTTDCGGSSGFLSVKRASLTTLTNQQVVIITAGSMLSPLQTRSSVGDKSAIANYLENENATPYDAVFTTCPTTPGAPCNDQLFTLPTP